MTGSLSADLAERRTWLHRARASPRQRSLDRQVESVHSRRCIRRARRTVCHAPRSSVTSIRRRAGLRLHADLSLSLAASTPRQRPRTVRSYLRTRFFRFLVSLAEASRSTRYAIAYSFVPLPDLDDMDWTDEALTRSTASHRDEIAFIEQHDPPDGTRSDE